MRQTALCLLLSSLLVAGCSASGGGGDAAASDALTDGPSAAINLTRSDGEWVDGAIFEGEAVTIAYDLDRVTGCRRGDGDPHHGPQFDYVLNYRWRASDGFTPALVGNANGGGSLTLSAPFGAEGLEFYVEHSNPRGCREYDSAGGANFNFPVRSARRPAVHFEGDGSVWASGELVAGRAVLVDYAPSRMPNCINSGRTMRLFGQIDGRDLEPRALEVVDGGRRATARVDTSPGDRALTVWFQTVDFRACTEWDSNFGQNFSFDLR